VEEILREERRERQMRVMYVCVEGKNCKSVLLKQGGGGKRRESFIAKTLLKTLRQLPHLQVSLPL
jgi:hypothetical protein